MHDCSPSSARHPRLASTGLPGANVRHSVANYLAGKHVFFPSPAKLIAAFSLQGEGAMRFSATVLALALGATSAFAQNKPVATGTPAAAVPSSTSLHSKCAKLAGKVTATDATSQAQLFMLRANGWQEISHGFFGSDLTVENYQGEQLSFIYVVPPSTIRDRQFLSIRTMADTDSPDHWVNLRRQLSNFDSVLLKTYQGYHSNHENSGTLQRFHNWNGDHSDKPDSTRQAWRFQSSDELARHRVLAIPYRASEKPLCVPFFLGPNIATAADEIEGDDEITVRKDFTVEITEAKTAAGQPGRTFKIHSPQAKVQ
jgi:hypothetical protein